MHPNDGFPSARALRIGAATVAGVIVLLAGLVIGRATASSSTAPATSGRSSPTPSGPAVPAWATGATRMDHGVPVGYPHTADGALAAARNYDLALSATPLALDPQAYRDAALFLDVPSARERDASRIERSLAGLAPLIAAAHQGHPSRVVPFGLTTQLVGYRGDEAQVAVWAGAVFAADRSVPPQLVLAETLYSLQWLGDWRIVDDTAAAGPGVKAMTVPAQTNDLPVELGGSFKGIGDAVAP